MSFGLEQYTSVAASADGRLVDGSARPAGKVIGVRAAFSEKPSRSTASNAISSFVVMVKRQMSFLPKAETDGPAPEVFVLDLNLPKINGRDILRHLRDGSRFAQAPVIILTSSDNPIDRADCVRIGADRYVRKVANVSDFLKIGGVVKAMITEEHTLLLEFR